MSLTIREIIERGGGSKGLHARSKEIAAQKRRKGPAAKVVPEKTIYAWYESGIPERHWWWVMPACNVTEVELHRANEERRSPAGGQSLGTKARGQARKAERAAAA